MRPQVLRHRNREFNTQRPQLTFLSLLFLDVAHNATPDASSEQQPQSSPAVRFKSTIEEIAPDDSTAPCPADIKRLSLGDPGEVTPEQLRDLSKKLKACPLQERRMNIFSYEAFSLPASRVRTPRTTSTGGVAHAASVTPLGGPDGSGRG
jgi:hypothetical protein